MFNVVLDTPPSADVTIGISSNDSTEGTTGVTSLTFTTASWDTPQTVTVTGVDDLDIDGDIAYNIITAAAAMRDPDYNGLDAHDVSVTNLDDEQPPVLTYSNDAQMAIPDPGTITSTIYVADTYQIADLNITLNIDHNRAADLDVYLIAPGPGGTRVELFTDVGGNGDDFTGTALDDQAGTSITQGSAPFTGSYRPEGNLSDFVGSHARHLDAGGLRRQQQWRSKRRG